MKAVFFIFLSLITSLLVAQPISGIWQGKIYDTHNEPVKYINVSFTSNNNVVSVSIRKFDKASGVWAKIEGLRTQFINSPTGGVLSSVNVTEKSTESETYIFSYVNSKRIEIEWISQIDHLEQKNSKLTKKGEWSFRTFLRWKSI